MTNQKKSPKPTKNFGDKIKKFCKENSKSIILASILLATNTFVVISKIYSNKISFFSKRAIIAYLLLIVLSILIIFILIKAKNKNWKLEKIFLICGFALGTFYTIMLPIGGAPDEPAHFWRSYELSEGRFLPETNSDGQSGIYIPDNLKSIISFKYSNYKNGYALTLADLENYPSDTYVLSSLPADSYTPFNYIPQVVGIWIGKIFHLPVIPMMYLSRLLNMIFCITIIFFCIKYSPSFKKIIFLIALFPMTMQLFASVSADGSIICAGISLIAFTLYAKKSIKRKFHIKDFALLFFICSSLVLSKPVYAPLCLILFWIPKTYFSTNKRKFFSIFTLGSLIFILLLIKVFLTQNGSARFDSATQISFILSYPIKFIAILIQNILFSPEQFINGTIGKELEWFSVGLFTPYIITFFLFFAFLCSEQELKISRGIRIFTISIFSIMVASIFAAMFIVWTPPESTLIEGVQGRYFLPIILLIPLFCQPSKKPKKLEVVKRNYLIIFSTLVNVYAIVTIFCSHI